MRVGIYLAFNPPLPEVCLGSDGKLLAKHLDTLDRLAQVATAPAFVLGSD